MLFKWQQLKEHIKDIKNKEVYKIKLYNSFLIVMERFDKLCA